MRIGILCSFGVGGADKASFYLAKGFKELGHDVVIFYTSKSFPDHCSQWDVGQELLCRFDSYKGFEMHQINDSVELKNYNLDILSTMRGGSDFWFINLELYAFDFPIIETNFHGDIFTKCDYRIFPSQALVDFKKIPAPYSVIPNPIMPKLSEHNLREELGIPNEAFVFGKISRPANDIFIEIPYRAYQIIQSPNTYFIQMGMNEATASTVNSLGITNFIHVGQTLDEERISKFYNTFDVYCHSNKIGETFGNTISESMIHKKPTVSHLGMEAWPQAQCELLEEFPNFIVQSREPDSYIQYAKLMKTLMDNPRLCESYANYCKLKADKYYDYRVVCKKYIELFKEWT